MLCGTSISHILLYRVCELNPRYCCFIPQLHKFYGRAFARVLYFILMVKYLYIFIYIDSHTYYVLDSRQAVVSGVVPLTPRFLPSIFSAHLRVRQSHCSSNFHEVLLTNALALPASQFVPKKESLRIYSSVHSAGFELTKLTYTRPGDNLMHHRGDRLRRYRPVTPLDAVRGNRTIFQNHFRFLESSRRKKYFSLHFRT